MPLKRATCTPKSGTSKTGVRTPVFVHRNTAWSCRLLTLFDVAQDVAHRLPAKFPAFEDHRLEELLFRYRARNFPQTLDDDERARWTGHCSARLHHGAGGALTLAAYLERIDALAETADARGQAILEGLVDYGEQIAPPND